MDKKFNKKVQLNGVKLHNSEQNTNFFFTQIIEQTSCKYTCKKKQASENFITKQCYSAVGEKWFSKLTHCNNRHCWWFRRCTCTSIFVDSVGLNSPLPVI